MSSDISSAIVLMHKQNHNPERHPQFKQCVGGVRPLQLNTVSQAQPTLLLEIVFR